jgi:PAS domain S-box-containing protein
VRWVRIFARPEVNAENKITAIVGAVKDISESKKAEEDLRQSEEKYRFLIENMKDIIWQASPDLKFTYISKAGQLLEGYKPEEIIGRSIFDFMTPESKSELMERISVRKNLLQNGERIDDAVYEVQYIKKNGELIWVEVSVYPMYDEVGRLTHFQGLTRDINYRKQMEEDLRESEFRNRAMVEAIPDLIFIQNREGTYIDYHAPNPQLLVAQPKLLLGCNVRDVLPPELAAEFLPKFDLAFETGKIQKHEYFLDAIEGKRCFESRMIAYSNDMLLSIVRDITQQKAMEQTLIEMGEIQRLLLNSIESTSIILLDLAEIVLTVNDFGIKLFEKNRDEIVGRFIYELFPTDSIEAKALLEERRKHFQEVIQTATPVTFEDFRQGIWFENNFYPILDNEGNVIQVAVYARDITKQKEKELLLSQSEKHYRALAESSQDMIYVIDRNDCFVYVNACVERYFGLFPDAFIGQPRSKFFRLPEVEMTRKNLNQVLETGTPFYSEAEFTLSIGKVYLSTWLVPLINSEGVVESVLGVSHDTTRFKDLEMALVEVNLKLESKVEERTRELLASRNQSKALTRQVVSAQEEERRRLSRELHDEAGQALVGLRFSLDAIYREIPENDLKINKHIAQSLVMVDQTLSRIRSLAYELRPPVLELMGIDSSIKQLCQDYSEKTGVKIEYSGQKLENLEDEIGISLYRFVQEALTNVAKHAQAAKVQVKLNYHDGIITSSVQDDGQGISKNFGKGLGLLGIKERFEVLDGQVEIRPCEPKGTIIQVSLPWKAFKTPLKTKYSSAL